MDCQNHKYKKVSYKCISCIKFMCNECSKLHQSQRHDVITILELADIIKMRITQQINKMNGKIQQLCHLKDFETGQSVIDGCMQEIQDFIKKLFDQIRVQYKKIVDQSWKQQNLYKIQQIQNKKSALEEWRQIIVKKSDQAAYFDIQKIYTANKLQSDQELIDSSESYMISNMSPKIGFNQIALRRANQSLTKIIYTQAKFKSPNKKKIIKVGSKKSLKQQNNLKYLGLSKFIQGSNILFEYIIQDPQLVQFQSALTRTEFREFVTPMRSVSVNMGSSIYLIGGYNKQNKPRKQIYLYQKTYVSMRIVGLLKQGRIGHAVCAYEDDIYIFGGKSALTLEQFNTKTKLVQIVGQLKSVIIGASMTAVGSKIYIVGGTDGVETNKKIYRYDTIDKKLEQITPMNIDIYAMPICPILQPLSQNQLLIFGGYFTFSGQSYNNSYLILFNCRVNFMSVFGTGQLIYPIMANGDNSILKDGTVISLVDLKRQRHKHGPNLPALFSLNLNDQTMQLDTIGV